MNKHRILLLVCLTLKIRSEWTENHHTTGRIKLSILLGSISHSTEVRTKEGLNGMVTDSSRHRQLNKVICLIADKTVIFLRMSRLMSYISCTSLIDVHD